MSVTKNKYSRREFVTKGASGLAAVSLFNFHDKPVLTPEENNDAQKIIHRDLGKTGIKLPVVNMGVMNASNPALVKKSYEIGVRYFDTAAYYQQGKNEEMIGKALKDLGVRDNVIIGTKVFIHHNQRDMSPKQAKAFFLKTADESLKRLQTDYVDVLFSHNVYNLEYLNNPGILEALQQLKEQKKIRFSGFTTHKNMNDCILNAVKSGHYDVITMAFNYAMYNDDNYLNTLQKAHAKGIGLIAMKTQCAQYWYSQRLPQSMQSFYQGKIMHTAVLKWVLRHPFIDIAIPGYTTFEQMDEDFSVVRNLDYTAEEKKFLEDRNVKYSLGYCIQCGKCVSTCPHAVDIPTLMRTHLYSTCYANFHEARSALNSIEQNHDLKTCQSCEHCLATCDNRIDIAQRIEELKLIYA